MTVEDRLAANKAALALAQKSLLELQSKVEEDTAAIRRVQPHLTLLDSIESELAMIEATVEPPIATQIEPLRLRILDNIIEIRNLLVAQSEG